MRPVAVLDAALVLATTAAAATVITRHAKTASYSLTLVVGPMEAMYTQAQVGSMHPKSGEVMVRGSMTGGSMSAMKGESERHLELHVRSRAKVSVVVRGEKAAFTFKA
jgi:hypothetical protein